MSAQCRHNVRTMSARCPHFTLLRFSAQVIIGMDFKCYIIGTYNFEITNLYKVKLPSRMMTPWSSVFRALQSTRRPHSDLNWKPTRNNLAATEQLNDLLYNKINSALKGSDQVGCNTVIPMSPKNSVN